MQTSRICSRQKNYFKVIDKATGFSLYRLEKLVLNTWPAPNSSPLLAFLILKLVPDKFDMPVRLWSKWHRTRDTDIISVFFSQKEDIESEFYLVSVSCMQW